MTDQELDRILRRAMLRAAEEEFQAVLSTPDTLPPASPRHERSMQRMCRDPLAWARRQVRPFWQQALRTAAMLALACALTLAALLTASPEARARVKNWFLERGDHGAVYTFSGDQPEEELPRYVLEDVPDGYALDDGQTFDTPLLVGEFYTNADGKRLYFQYHYMFDGAAMSVSTEHVTIYDITFDGCPAQLFISDLPDKISNALVWVDEEANIQFMVDGFFDSDELCEIARSVRKK